MVIVSAFAIDSGAMAKEVKPGTARFERYSAERFCTIFAYRGQVKPVRNRNVFGQCGADVVHREESPDG